VGNNKNCTKKLGNFVGFLGEEKMMIIINLIEF